MNVARVERLCLSALRNTSQQPPLIGANPQVLIRRLEAHLQKSSARSCRRGFATTTKCCSLTHIPPAPDAVPVSFSIHEVTKTPLQQVLPAKHPSRLPRSCPGCGALSQTIAPDQAGFYDTSRRLVRKYLKKQKALSSITTLTVNAEQESEEHEEVEKTAASTDLAEESSERDYDDEWNSAPCPSTAEEPQTAKIPICNRCNELINHSRGTSIIHPSMSSIADSIAESPFRRNHVYHVVDAADFPLSVVPEVFKALELAKPRSKNRRSQHDFSTKPTVSFIISRSDLLGPSKEVVDTMMTYFQNQLREALGRAGKDMRLGNVHLVSAKRGWWTKGIKADIWNRGGGNWMVGKANVGKSELFQVLFPKGSGERASVYAELQQKQIEHSLSDSLKQDAVEEKFISEDSLLPPAQEEAPFPTFPVVSSLSGTTASPIRLPFGGHKGELIDMPGLERSNLEDYVQQEHKLELTMTHRHKVEPHIIKPGQSLLLGGGLIRITPQLNSLDRSITVSAYPFVPLKAHVTSTEKAIAQQLQQRQSGIETILAENIGSHMALAGKFELSTDVTKARAGPLIRAGRSESELPFRVYATDILVEGMGWIELVCQVRKKTLTQPASKNVAEVPESSTIQDPQPSETPSLRFASGFTPFEEGLAITTDNTATRTTSSQLPTVEVFSPKGKHVGQRPCLQAWTRWQYANILPQKVSPRQRKPMNRKSGRRSV